MVVPIIILNYNSSADCRNCISSLKSQEGVDTEIIVVDNNSNAKDRRQLEEICFQDDCILLQCDTNGGYNAGNNVGLRYAIQNGYDFALIANPDMIFPQKNYLAELCKAILADNNIAVCGSDIITPDGFHQNPLQEDDREEENFKWLMSLFKEKDPYCFIDNHHFSHFCNKVSGCCFIVRLEFVEEIGYFDEQSFLYCEEAILSKQVKRSGKWKEYYLSTVQAVHRHVMNEKGNPVRRHKQWQRSRMYYIRNYGDKGWLRKAISSVSFCLYIRSLILLSFIKRI